MQYGSDNFTWRLQIWEHHRIQNCRPKLIKPWFDRGQNYWCRFQITIRVGHIYDCLLFQRGVCRVTATAKNDVVLGKYDWLSTSWRLHHSLLHDRKLLDSGHGLFAVALHIFRPRSLNHCLLFRFIYVQTQDEVACEFDSSIMKDILEILRSAICFCLLICSCDAYFWSAKPLNKDVNSDTCATGACSTLRVSYYLQVQNW